MAASPPGRIAGLRRACRALARRAIYRVPGEVHRCPACGSRYLFELDLMALVVAGRRRLGFVTGCEECGLVFTNPQPTASELAHFYTPGGEWEPPRDDPADEERRAARARSRSWSRLFEPIRHELSVTAPPAGARVLDFGCADGALLDAMQACGWETWGIEPAMDIAFRRHRRLDAVPQEPTFDLIVAHHVLEHVPNPLGVLGALARACRDGGFLFVGVPRLDTLPLHRDYKYVINGRAHVVAFTWPCLQGLLMRAGWMPVAPPADEVSTGAGGPTRARLQVMARRSSEPTALPGEPARAARMALHGYYAGGPNRSLLERAGLYRLAARRAAAERARRKTRKSTQANSESRA
jgi:SAM-dependent methyltransferase